MKKLNIILCLLMLLSFRAWATDADSSTKRTIHVAVAGTLPELIPESEKYDIEELTLTGELNGTDFRLLRDMAGNNYLGEPTNGNLALLDLTDVKVVKGGEKYLDTNYIEYEGGPGGNFHFDISQDNVIPQCVFCGCKLKTIRLPSSLTKVGSKAFRHCIELTSISIPNLVTDIEGMAFYDCSKLNSIVLPNSLKTIGNNAFCGCSKLTSIIIPKSVISIGYQGVLSKCSNLSSIKVEDGNMIYDSRGDCNAIIETKTNTLIIGCKSTIIPNSVTTIGVWAFRYCKELISITIPNSVTSIGSYAFEDCSGLTGTLIIPNSVTSVGEYAFERCSGFSAIVVENGNTAYDSRNGCNAIIETKTNTLIFGCKNSTIPNSVTSIGNKAFLDCSGLTSLTIPNSVTFIGSSAFGGCSGLTSLTIPNSVTSIGSSAFSNCSGLTGSFTIPNSVTSIGSWAFSGCNGIDTVKSEIEEPFEISNDVFYSSPKHKTLQVPKGTKSKYMALNGWTTYFNEVIEEIKTYNLSITATGNGSATYNDTAVRGKTQSFTVNEGTSATVTFAPDAGYRIASVKLNGTDVTSSVVSNKYTISNITANTTLAVTFEAITHTLSITATGNGSVTYNNTAIRGKTQAFSVNEGSSATIIFSPDAGYRIASVKVNDKDVTASVANNSYTISNISANTTLAVTFEAIPPSTYLLNIVAVGNGSVSYNNTTIRNQSKEFTIVEKSAVTIMMSPDNGYRVASVKVNDTDVTSQVSNGQITISSIMQDTNVEVVFEEIPPTTYSLTITATGNGTVTYDGNTIRDNSSAFTVVEGSYVTVQITPDAGYRLKQVTLDGKDVTADVANGQYTTAKMMANTTLAVEFVEAVTELAVNGVNYRVVSQDGQTVNVASGNYGLTLTVPATFEAKGKTWTVVGIDSDALANATELAAVIWQPEAAFTAKVSNPNLLLYVSQSQYAPSDIQNVVVGDQAENIILTEAESGNNFYCPKAFTARRISYEHNYSMTSGYKTCQGWETLVLPFDVTMMINAKGIELVPRSTWTYGSSLRTFWLYQLTDQGWQAAEGIKANIPYILCMPNNEMYDASYNQTGNIQYIGNNVQVMASEGLKTSKYGNKQLVANYQNQAANNGIYALNVSNEWYQNTATEAEGSTFIRSLRNVHPFEAYMTMEGSNARAIPIFVDDNTTKLTPIPSPKGEGRDGWYDLQGRKLQNEPKQKGIYIYKGKRLKK